MRLALFAIAVLSFGVSPISAETIVKVKLHGGRTYRGIVDSLTNEEKLWLRSSVGDVQLQRPIAWNRIDVAEIEEHQVTVAELKGQVEKLATPAPKKEFVPAPRQQPPIREELTPLPLTSIQCEAWLANWDADPLSDGLVATIVGVDENGNQVAVRGTVEAELIAIDRVPGYQASTSDGLRTISLGRWNRTLDEGQSVVKLEFQRRQPELDRAISRYGQLQIRVTSPGFGVFEQTIDGIRTRRFTPVADQLLIR